MENPSSSFGCLDVQHRSLEKKLGLGWAAYYAAGITAASTFFISSLITITWSLSFLSSFTFVVYVFSFVLTVTSLTLLTSSFSLLLTSSTGCFYSSFFTSITSGILGGTMSSFLVTSIQGGTSDFLFSKKSRNRSVTSTGVSCSPFIKTLSFFSLICG